MEIIRKRNTIIVPELAQFIPFEAGATWNMLWKVLYYTRLLKYVHQEQYKRIQKTFQKICTKDNLYGICETGLLNSPSENVFITTDKALLILKEVVKDRPEFMVDTLPAQSQGKGDINELNNTEAFISLMKKPNFHTFLFPNFEYLIPDALMVQLDNDAKRFKLTFIEIEAKKPEWESYIEVKKNNYLRLSQDIKCHEYWEKQSKLLKFGIVDIRDFRFTYNIIKN